jgi:hypothetical protein
MPKLTPNTSAVNLTIDGVQMNCAAWQVLNLHVLLQPADQRGEDRLIPGSAGVLPLKRRETVTRHGLQMLISGTHDINGSANANTVQQLFTNIEYLNNYVVAPTGTGNGTRTAVFSRSGQAVNLTEPIHVTGLELGQVREDGQWIRAVLNISIPSGRFN